MAERGSIIIFSSHRMEHVELFCKKLVVLLNGKTVLKGDLQKIKEDYQKKNIRIKGNVDINEIKKIKGVLQVEEKKGEIEVKIENKEVISNVFSVVSKGKNILKFEVEEPSLNEIFVEKVGESYEK